MSEPEHRHHGPETTAHFRDEFAAQLAAMHDGLLPEEEEAVEALPLGSALLIVRRGSNAGARFLLDTDITAVGRHPDADIFLDDVTVSRRHAEFRRQGSSFSLHDFGSLNGSYYNGEQIESVELLDGGEIQIGKFKMTFYASRADALPGTS